MEIRPSQVTGWSIWVDTSEKWLIFKALDALLSSKSRDSYEEKLIKDMMDKIREVEHENN